MRREFRPDSRAVCAIAPEFRAGLARGGCDRAPVPSGLTGSMCDPALVPRIGATRDTRRDGSSTHVDAARAACDFPEGFPQLTG
jgi:hypothetical protein